MAVGTATNRLRKMLMFHFAQKCGMDICFQCNERIESAEDLSIEHMVPWRRKPNAKELFYDLNNIAFSHQRCNCIGRRQRRPQPCPSLTAYRNGCRCEGCKQRKRETR